MKIQVYKEKGHKVNIEQTRVKRDWMDATDDGHAYKCFPVTFANTVGWSISFPDDIEVIWDGILSPDPEAGHVKVIKSGDNTCHLGRANGTVSFHSGLIFKTEENMSILSIVPPNFFIDGATPFTSLISTSFFPDPFPIAWRITRPNHSILIPAGTPVATLIPISIGALSEIELDIYDHVRNEKLDEMNRKKFEKGKELSMQGKFTNFYRDAVDPDGNSMGSHERKSLKLKINDFTKNKDGIM